MRKIKYRLVVSDFDGTLVKRDTTIGELSKNAIAEYIRNGGYFALSSGRMPHSIQERAKELGLQGIVCAYQGSVIMDIESGKVYSEGKLDYNLALEACKDFEEKGYHFHIYDFDKFYSNMDDDGLRAYAKATNEKTFVNPNLAQFMIDTGFVPYKILVMVHADDLMSTYNYLSEKYGDRCYVTCSSRHFVELCNKHYSKGTSVEYLMQRFGVSKQETMAIGDQINDLPMLKTAGLGIAVKNCQEQLKDQVFVYDYTNEEDAVGRAIEQFAYEE